MIFKILNKIFGESRLFQILLAIYIKKRNEVEMKRTQADVVLEMLRLGPVTTKDIFEKWIMAPQKVIETLRKKGYNILTSPVENEKYCIYTLIPTSEQTKLF